MSRLIFFNTIYIYSVLCWPIFCVEAFKCYLFNVLYIIIEACIGGTKYPISLEVNRQVSLLLANIPIVNFHKYAMSLKVTKY